MKIAKIDGLDYDCFVILTDGLMPQELKVEVMDKFYQKYGKVTVFNASSKPSESNLWMTNKFGNKLNRHEDYLKIDFDFVIFKDSKLFI